MPAPIPRSLRIPSELWNAVGAKAKAEGTTRTALVIAFFEKYLKR